MRRWRRLLALQAAVSGLVAFAVTAIWVMTGGGSFWPIWVWYGLAIPFGLNAALYGAAHVKRGRWRKFAFHAAVSGWVSATLVLTWAMAGSDEFWPTIPVVCLAMLLALHAVLAAMWGGDQELVERVDELTRTRRGALDVQAHELRRIERDLHDGAQARLVALTMQLGRAEARLEDNPEAAELVREARGEAKEAIAELRDLARGIAPPVLADRGLPAAVEAVAARSAIPADCRRQARPPAAAGGRDGGLLRGRRVAHQRRQARRQRGARPGPHPRRPRSADARDHGRRPRRRQPGREWPDRAAPPRRGARRRPRGHQRRRARHGDPRRAPVRTS